MFRGVIQVLNAPFGKQQGLVNITSGYCRSSLWGTSSSTACVLDQQNVIMSLGASGSVWELSDQNPREVKYQRLLDCTVAFRCTWEYRGAPTTSLGAPATSLGAPATNLGAPATGPGAPRFTGDQSGWNTLFSGNTAGGAGKHSYYLSFNNF